MRVVNGIGIENIAIIACIPCMPVAFLKRCFQQALKIVKLTYFIAHPASTFD